MLKLLGAALVTLCGLALGLDAVGSLARRERALRSLCAALTILERELAFRLPPLPELFRELGAQSPPPAAELFARCAGDLERLGERPFAQLWTAAAESLPDLTGEDRAILAQLGAVLGRWDAHDQRQAVEEVRLRLSEQAAQAASRRGREGRAYGVLGLSLGLFTAIVLL